MYTPKSFAIHDRETALDMIRQNPFGILLHSQDSEVEVSHLPFHLVSESGAPDRLFVHMARANNQWRNILHDANVLVVFRGAHAYISPRWYTNPKDSVPTWNYQAVHVHGHARMLDESELFNYLVESTRVYEGEAWSIEAMDSQALARRLKAIVGFEIQINRLQAKFKLSQNKHQPDRTTLLEHLQNDASPELNHMAQLIVDHSSKKPS